MPWLRPRSIFWSFFPVLPRSEILSQRVHPRHGKRRATTAPLWRSQPGPAGSRCGAERNPQDYLFDQCCRSSITIDGIEAVIDSGLARVLSYSPWNGLSRLQVEKISRASAIQRTGRAGRTGPGLAIRLFPESDFVPTSRAHGTGNPSCRSELAHPSTDSGRNRGGAIALARSSA